MDRQEVTSWIRLSLCQGVGPSLFVQLVDAFGHPAEVLKAGESELAAFGFTSLVHQALKRAPADTGWDSVSSLIDEGVRFITYRDPSYPYRLKQIASYPPFLFVRGNEKLLNDEKSVAVVGTRNPTAYGTTMAKRLAEDLTAQGFLIVSGYALGIDIVAHRACFEANAPTVAVLAHGLDMIAPLSHKKYMPPLLEAGGAFVTEHLPGRHPLPCNFPRRNRIISGLSRGVVIVEAKERSGALITARYALEQNRDVFAVPGDVRSEFSRGPNRLIQQGAKLIMDAEDLLGEWNYQRQMALPLERKKGNALLDLILEGFQTVDQLVSQTNKSPEVLLSQLTELELDGRLTSLPGGRFAVL